MKEIWELLTELNDLSTAVRIVLAVLLGGFIGLERGHRGRAAGLRTHILVCLGAALSALVGLYTASVLHFDNDPLRVGAQVVSGIGFLGVGTIIINRQQVTGLTTAAGLWATACIGLSVGVGYYVAALVAFLAVIITMEIFVFLERSVKNRVTYLCYIELTDLRCVNDFFEEIRPFILSADLTPARSGVASHVGLEIKTTSSAHYEQIMKKASNSEHAVISLPMQT